MIPELLTHIDNDMKRLTQLRKDKKISVDVYARKTVELGQLYHAMWTKYQKIIFG